MSQKKTIPLREPLKNHFTHIDEPSYNQIANFVGATFDKDEEHRLSFENDDKYLEGKCALTNYLYLAYEVVGLKAIQEINYNSIKRFALEHEWLVCEMIDDMCPKETASGIKESLWQWTDPTIPSYAYTSGSRTIYTDHAL